VTKAHANSSPALDRPMAIGASRMALVSSSNTPRARLDRRDVVVIEIVGIAEPSSVAVDLDQEQGPRQRPLSEREIQTLPQS
jgi:hypothetical protein